MTYRPNKSVLVRARTRLGNSPLALWAISKAVCRTAPYFSTIRPRFTTLEPGHVEAHIPLRKPVTNHLGTMHAIAMCNAAEFVGGCLMELSCHGGLRWIPVGMEVEYVALAKTDLRAVCIVEAYQTTEPGELITPVKLYDKQGNEVFWANIRMRLTERKKTAS